MAQHNPDLQGDPNAGGVDPFAAPIPGQSLTREPGNAPFEKPPEIADPEDAISYLVNKINEPRHGAQMLQLIDAGVAIEEITKVMTFAGFSQGKWTPDVAELIKPAIFLHVLDAANEAGITDATLYTRDPNEGEPQKTDDALTIMSALRPEKYDKLDQPELPGLEPAEEDELNGFMSG